MGGHGSGRRSREEELVHHSKEIVMSNNEEINIPNFSGDHSVGRVNTAPVQDTDIANKAYVDSVTGGESTTVTDTASLNLTLTGSAIKGDVLPAGVDHDSLQNFVTAEHVDWAEASAGTIHASNYVDNNDNTQLTNEQVEDIAGGLVASGGTKTGISITYQDATGDMDFDVDHDTTTNFVANEHIDHTSITFTAGTGLSGGGTLAANRTFNLDNVSIANGGTGQTGQTAAFDALSPTTTKGDLIASNGSDNLRLAIGSNDQVLTADSSEATGVKWVTPSAGGSEWTDTGTVLHPTDSSGTLDNVVVGGTTQAGADIILNLDGSAVFNEQGNSTADFRVETDAQVSALHIDYANDNIGMFIDPASAPDSSISIGNIPTQLNRYKLGVGFPFTETTGSQAGSLYSINANPSGTSDAATYGLFVQAGIETGNSQNITSPSALIGGSFSIRNRGTGTLTATAALLAAAVSSTTTGTITTNYGLFIDKQNHNDVTTSWGLYVNHASDPNYMAGTLSLGTTTTGEKLLVEGAIQLDEKSDPSGTSGYGKIYVGTDTRVKYIDSTGNKIVFPQVIDTNITAVGNVGSGQDNLMTHTVDETNHMGVNGDRLHVIATGKIESMTTGTLKMFVGATEVFSNGEMMSTSVWIVTAEIIRISTSVQKIYWSIQDDESNITVFHGVTEGTVNFDSNFVIKFTGEDGDGDDDGVTQEYMQITHYPSSI